MDGEAVTVKDASSGVVGDGGVTEESFQKHFKIGGG